jgi:methylated-DNA-[protein]-cysteine S-methyltransferase
MGAVRTSRGLARTILPHGGIAAVRGLLATDCPDARQDIQAFAELIALARAYFAGRRVSFRAVRCDLPPAATFAGRVLRACRNIPYGRTISYGRLASAAGNPKAARAAAAVMARNPMPLVIPCHRVIYADGGLGGFSAPAGVVQKRRLLRLEGAF